MKRIGDYWDFTTKPMDHQERLVAYHHLHLDEILMDFRSFLISLRFEDDVSPIMGEAIDDGVVCLAFSDIGYSKLLFECESEHERVGVLILVFHDQSSFLSMERTR